MLLPSPMQEADFDLDIAGIRIVNDGDDDGSVPGMWWESVGNEAIRDSSWGGRTGAGGLGMGLAEAVASFVSSPRLEFSLEARAGVDSNAGVALLFMSLGASQ